MSLSLQKALFQKLLMSWHIIKIGLKTLENSVFKQVLKAVGTSENFEGTNQTNSPCYMLTTQITFMIPKYTGIFFPPSVVDTWQQFISALTLSAWK